MSQSTTVEPAVATSTMRAAVQHQFGDPSTIQIEPVGTPGPGSGEVLIRTRIAGINPVDAYISGGGHFSTPYPESVLEEGVTPGWDIAGDVVGVGPDVTDYVPGDRVFGLIRFPEFGRTFAEFATAPVNEIRRIPEGVSYEAAGAVPLVGLTAWQSLFDHADLRAGQRVLIHGASGGVGHLAVQLAKHAGAHVIATASAGNAAMVRELGADEVVDYTTQRFEDVVRDVDVVLNAFGDDVLARSWSVLKPGGILVSIFAYPTVVPERLRSVRPLVEPNGEQIRKLGELMAEGSLRVVIGQAFPFERVQDAFRARNSGHAVGKMVMTF
jgi:NADPH:quinone reductase-like Zn-dependent oxidoreductase